ncbi:MAG: FAD-dependent oxidoreductase [Clostridiales bacterium]|jgi:2,4-dienoyl-CoA reductase-like NADH-dependent reductase (Old Yellow Enzyme family)/thioredoxin reductase|nr:FAD-dependent oxidoreductase [Clostridiales bacterium]
MTYTHLLSEGKIGKITIKNRVVMAPMCLGVGQLDGTPSEKMLDYYEARAKGGAGLIITEITRVDDRTGASTFVQLAASKDCHTAPLSALAERIHRHGAKVFVQLHHPGRQNVGLMVDMIPLCTAADKVTRGKFQRVLLKIMPAAKLLLKHNFVLSSVAPSKCPPAYFAGGRVRALRKAEIKRLIGKFVDAAERVKTSGCDGVELHAAHGYLLQQFLSPYTNKREDEYGGCLDNRLRFLTDIIAGIRERCGKDFPIIVRLSVDEMYRYIGKENTGYALEEGVLAAKILERAGIDAIDVSSAGYDAMNYWLEPVTFDLGWRKNLAAAVKKAVKIPVIAANLIRSPEQAEEQLASGVQDFVALGRPFLADPEWVDKVAEGKPDSIKRCFMCLHCFESMQHNAYKLTNGGCAANPALGAERERASLEKTGQGKTVAIVGGGPAGLTAAEILSERGYNTILFEKESRLGGQVYLASRPPKKDKTAWCIDDLAAACRRNGADIRLNTPADKKTLAELSPYAVIIATGGDTLRPASINGIDGANVVSAADVLSGKVVLENKKIVIAGSGMTGLETAELLAGKNKLAVAEMADTVGPGAWFQHLDDILPKLKSAGVKFLTDKQLTSVTEYGVTLKDTRTRAAQTLACDTVILALGVRPERKLYDELSGNGAYVTEKTNADGKILLFKIGDADKSGNIAHATETAYALCKTL